MVRGTFARVVCLIVGLGCRMLEERRGEGGEILILRLFWEWLVYILWL